MASHIYTCTRVDISRFLTGDDLEYGVATLTIIPDGSHPLDRPPEVSVRVPPDYQPGKEWRITITEG